MNIVGHPRFIHDRSNSLQGWWSRFPRLRQYALSSLLSPLIFSSPSSALPPIPLVTLFISFFALLISFHVNRVRKHLVHGGDAAINTNVRVVINGQVYPLVSSPSLPLLSFSYYLSLFRPDRQQSILTSHRCGVYGRILASAWLMQSGGLPQTTSMLLQVRVELDRGGERENEKRGGEER